MSQGKEGKEMAKSQGDDPQRSVRLKRVLEEETVGLIKGRLLYLWACGLGRGREEALPQTGQRGRGVLGRWRDWSVPGSSRFQQCPPVTRPQWPQVLVTRPDSFSFLSSQLF